MAEVPKLQVQRMGKKYRIVYAETRNLAVFNSGEPVDGGGFEDVWENNQMIENGQLEAMKKLSLVMGGQVGTDPDGEETIGH